MSYDVFTTEATFLVEAGPYYDAFRILITRHFKSTTNGHKAKGITRPLMTTLRPIQILLNINLQCHEKVPEKMKKPSSNADEKYETY